MTLQCIRPPHPPTLCSISTPQSFAQALLSLPAYTQANPLGRLEAQYIIPVSLILNQNVTFKEVVGLAVGSAASNRSSSGSSLPLPLPLLMTGPTFPMQRGLSVPPIVAFNLAGCVGCLALTDSTVHVYLTQMLLTGRTEGGGRGAGDGGWRTGDGGRGTGDGGWGTGDGGWGMGDGGRGTEDKGRGTGHGGRLELLTLFCLIPLTNF